MAGKFFGENLVFPCTAEFFLISSPLSSWQEQIVPGTLMCWFVMDEKAESSGVNRNARFPFLSKGFRRNGGSRRRKVPDGDAIRDDRNIRQVTWRQALLQA
jgi:hypothetical protein